MIEMHVKWPASFPFYIHTFVVEQKFVIQSFSVCNIDHDFIQFYAKDSYTALLPSRIHVPGVNSFNSLYPQRLFSRLRVMDDEKVYKEREFQINGS